MDNVADMQDTERLHAFETLLDDSRYATSQEVPLDDLRELCAEGIPDDPPHIRPLVYLILLGVLPKAKDQWRLAMAKKRAAYHAMVQIFMDELQHEPLPTEPLSPHDALLTSISRDVDALDSRIPFLRTRPSLSRTSPLGPPPDESTTNTEPESSSSDESFKGPSKGKQPVRHIISRRAAFVRLHTIAEATHRRQFNAGVRARSDTTGSISTTSSPESGLMSPKITLSMDPEPSRLASLRPPPLQTPQLSLSAPGSAASPSDAEAPSPVTLLSPKPLPASGSTMSSLVSGSLLQADRHGEAILRLVYVFCRAHAHWSYHRALLDLVSQLYLMFAGGSMAQSKRKMPPIPPSHHARWAEEKTFWATAAIMAELGDVVSHDPDAIHRAVSIVDSRIRWADPVLWTALQDAAVTTDQFATRWVGHALSADLAGENLLAIWDVIFSAKPAEMLDCIMDVLTAMVLLGKGPLLTPTAPEQIAGAFWGHVTQESVANVDGASAIALLRAYPLSRLGRGNLRQMAGGFRTARLAAAAQGDNSDTARPNASLWTDLSFGRLPDSRSPATMVKTSTDWTASALAKWSDASKVTRQRAISTSSSLSSLGSAAGRLWSSIRAAPKGENEPVLTAPSGTAATLRDRSDSGASGFSASTLQERLAKVGRSPPHTKHTSLQSPGGPRPLLLSGSARRASNPVGRSTSASPPQSSPPDTSLSPPSTGSQTPVGLYRIGSGAARRSPRSSMIGSSDAITVKARELDYGEPIL